MRKNPFILVLLYIFFLQAGSVFGIGEKVIGFGSTSSWNLIERRQGIIEVPLIRPEPVLVLAGDSNISASFMDSGSLDLCLSFEERRPGNFSDSMGHYDIAVSPELAAVTAPWSRVGTGAALFSGKNGVPPIVLKPGKSALFAPGRHLRDFSIEFWIYPLSMENGEQIVSWTSSKPDGQNRYIYQGIQCIVTRNRLQWIFGDFFSSPNGSKHKSLSFSGPAVLPHSWSHHLIRFDADLGLLEYLVDGKLEALEYTTSSGHEGGEVFTPVVGEDSRFVLGSRFSGIMDEFRIYSTCVEKASLAKFSSEGGRVESRTLDLGNAESRVLKIEAFGGRTGIPLASITAGKVLNEYAGNGALRFSDHAELQFFIRMNNSPYRWDDIAWIPFEPGAVLPDSFRGKYVQIAVNFYPGEDGETSPYLSELHLIYNAANPPPPPAQVTAVAKNGAVELSWNASPSKDVGGYLVYFGTARGEYFGVEAKASPINAGNRCSIRIDNLKNGTLYYFAVAAYSTSENPDTGRQGIEPGAFSREVAARPLLQPAEDS